MFDSETCFAPQRRAPFQHLNVQKWPETAGFLTLLAWKCASRHNGAHLFDIWTSKDAEHLVLLAFSLPNVLRATTARAFSTSHIQKVVRTRRVLTLLTSKCALHRNGVRFFDISTSKSGPNILCFDAFHFQTRFTPQRRELFRHLNFQECSEHGVF